MTRFLLLALSILFVSVSPAFAAAGHYVSGVEGIRAASLPPEGVYWRSYNAFYNSDRLMDNNRDKVGKFKASVYAMANRFIYSTPVEILGGNLLMDVIIPVQSTYISMRGAFEDSAFSLGDVFVEPVALAWHGDRYDLAVGFGAYVPTGAYDETNQALAGKGFWTFMFTGGGTLYFDDAKTWSASVLGRYEMHTMQYGTEHIPGNNLSVEWGLGKNFMQMFDVGVAGYGRWQTTATSGPGINKDLREEVYAVGPEIGFTYMPWGLGVSLRSLWEFSAKNTTEGNITTLTLSKAF